MVQVCQGTKTKNDMVVEAVEQYKEMFVKAKRDFEKVVAVRSVQFTHVFAKLGPDCRVSENMSQVPAEEMVDL